MTWPKKYGGHERTFLERYVVLAEMLAAGAPVGAHWVADRQSGPLLLRFGTEEQRQQRAFRAADRGDARFETAVAKVRVGEAAGICASLTHPVHGAIGFTYEHSLHFATRRLWSWRAEFGAESAWAIELGREAAARGADALWADLTAKT